MERGRRAGSQGVFIISVRRINHIPNFDWSFKNQAIDFVNSLKKNRYSISSGLDSLEDIRTIDKIWKKKFFSS